MLVTNKINTKLNVAKLLVPQQRRQKSLLTLLKAPIYVPKRTDRVAFPLEYSPKVYQSTEQVYYYA